MRQRAIAGAAALAWALALSGSVAAQTIRRGPPPRFPPRPAPPPLSVSSDDPGDFRARFGVELAARLLRSPDVDERLRGVERAAALGTPEALTLLMQQLDASSSTRNDARAKIAIARGLAPHVDQPTARSALVILVGLASSRASQKADAEAPDYAARVDVARRSAALALAQSGDLRAVESLAAMARGSGPGAAAATEALVAFPPSAATTAWARPLSAGTVRLVARIGDRRALESLLDAAKTADAETRAAAIDALGALGDSRVVEVARGSLTDEDARVRAAAAGALVMLGSPEAARAVEVLMADDATAARGIALAASAHGPGIVRALAARAAISADLEVRSSAVAALGRDPTADGIEALGALLKDPMLRGAAADAIARSPSPSAMGALERLAREPATRRLAVHAYVVRVIVRGQTSDALERVAGELARSRSADDRAVGVFARIALGRAELAPSLEDREPQVRRAAAMASLAHATSESRALLLARREREEDPTTRAVLSAGLAEGDDSARVSTRALLACARGGGADAPMCTLAFARRASEAESAEVDALLASRDPIVRTHAARGLAWSAQPTRVGRLTAAYAYEPDPLVRRAIALALVSLPRDVARIAGVADTVALAARLDPDPEVRWTAAHFPAGGAARSAPEEGDVAWIRLLDAGGAPAPAGATGALLRADGLAVPIAFDADGDALVPGMPAGGARLILAPRLDAAYARAP